MFRDPKDDAQNECQRSFICLDSEVTLREKSRDDPWYSPIHKTDIVNAEHVYNRPTRYNEYGDSYRS